MLGFLKNYSWFISLVAIILSIISSLYIFYEKFKINRLKSDNAILKPILDLNIEDFYSIENIKEKSHERTTFCPDYSKLYYLLQKIDESSIADRRIKKQILIVKKLEADKLIINRMIPNGLNSSEQFAPEVDELIKLTRIHLSKII